LQQINAEFNKYGIDRSDEEFKMKTIPPMADKSSSGFFLIFFNLADSINKKPGARIVGRGGGLIMFF